MQLRVTLEADESGYKGLGAGVQEGLWRGSWRPQNIPDAEQLVQRVTVPEPACMHKPGGSHSRHIGLRVDLSGHCYT